MEDHLFNALELLPGSQVLDAGCGAAHVAVHMAERGLRVVAIDLLPLHIQWAQQEVKAKGLSDRLSIRQMDFHKLDGIADASLNGVYTSETSVHACDPRRMLGRFFRVLKPGSHMALDEYEHVDVNTLSADFPNDLKDSSKQINVRAHMPSNDLFSHGVIKQILEEEVFDDIVIDDLSGNILLMLRLFFLVAYLPYLLISFLGLRDWFPNTEAGAQGYRGLKRGFATFVNVKARKPETTMLSREGIRQRTAGHSQQDKHDARK